MWKLEGIKEIITKTIEILREKNEIEEFDALEGVIEITWNTADQL